MPGEDNYVAVIKVVGVGGGGSNAVNRMISSDLRGVEFIVVNTDAQALVMSEADVKLDIGRQETRGLGAGADPTVGQRAAEEHVDEIKEVLHGADMVFVTAGEGGGTGTGAAPVIARIAREVGALTIGVVTKPFAFEGNRRMSQALNGIAELEKEVDALISIPNDRLLTIADTNLSMLDAFKEADKVLMAGVQGITEIISTNAVINVDFADVKSIMKDAGTAMMGVAEATGENRAVRAAEAAIASPLLESSIDGANGMLFFFQAGTATSLAEVSEAASMIQQTTQKEANVIFGMNFDDALGDQIRVTVIATGFERPPHSASAPKAAASTLTSRREARETAPAAAPAAPAPAPTPADQKRPLGTLPSSTEPKAPSLVFSDSAPAAPAPSHRAQVSAPTRDIESLFGEPSRKPRVFDEDDDVNLDLPDFLR